MNIYRNSFFLFFALFGVREHRVWIALQVLVAPVNVPSCCQRLFRDTQRIENSSQREVQPCLSDNLLDPLRELSLPLVIRPSLNNFLAILLRLLPTKKRQRSSPLRLHPLNLLKLNIPNKPRMRGSRIDHLSAIKLGGELTL
jgi:hypothetical protein